MNCEEARTHFVDYWNGALDDASFEFHTHLSSCERCQAEAEESRRLWAALEHFPEESPSHRVRQVFYDSLREWKQRESERRNRFWWSNHPVLQVAFAMLILLVGVGVGHFSATRNTSEMAQMRGELDNMRQTVTLALLQQQSAADR